MRLTANSQSSYRLIYKKKEKVESCKNMAVTTAVLRLTVCMCYNVEQDDHVCKMCMLCQEPTFLSSSLVKSEPTLKFFSLTVLSNWDFSRGKFELLSLGKASCDRVVLPNVWCMLCF